MISTSPVYPNFQRTGYVGLKLALSWAQNEANRQRRCAIQLAEWPSTPSLHAQPRTQPRAAGRCDLQAQPTSQGMDLAMALRC